MTRTRCQDLPEKLKLNLEPAEKRKYERALAKQKKIQKITEKFSEDGIRPIGDDLADQIVEWVDDDFEQMDFNEIDEKQFRDDLSSHSNIPIEKTGSRWYHHQKPLGRFLKSIREGNSANNRSTILIIRGGDESIYRLGIPKGKETECLSTAISKGYILTEVKVTSRDE